MHDLAHTPDADSRHNAVAKLAEVFGDSMTADHVGLRFGCTEANIIADILTEFGYRRAAATWLIGHAFGDDDSEDTHAHLVDYGEMEIDDSRARAERFIAPVPAGHARVLAESSYADGDMRGQLVDRPVPASGALDDAWWAALPTGDDQRGRDTEGSEHWWRILAAPDHPDLVGQLRAQTVTASDDPF